MKSILCTLFDSNYLDKGVLLYHSLEECSTDFSLYVLAMDEKCFQVISDLDYPHIIPIHLSSFENKELLVAKSNRSFGEYCWTCSSSLIQYVLNEYNEPYCAYVDSDMYFYEDPAILVEELESKSKSVLIVGHRFDKYDKINEQTIGRFCVEFTLFKKEERSLSLLQVWINQCLDSCSRLFDGIHYGDQKYLDNWITDYPFVMETHNLGAGVAPWNIGQYKLNTVNGNHISLIHSSKDIDLVFYHFESIAFLSPHLVNIHVYNKWRIDSALVDTLYDQYLHRIKSIRDYLFKSHGLVFGCFFHPEIIPDNDFKKRFMNFFKRIRQKGGVSYIIHNRIPSLLKSRKNLFYVA